MSTMTLENDPGHDGWQGRSLVLAVAPTLWILFSGPFLFYGDPFCVMGMPPLHWATCQPPWAGVFWAPWVRTSLRSSDSFQLLSMATELGWGKSSKQQPNTTWGRKHLQPEERNQLMSWFRSHLPLHDMLADLYIVGTEGALKMTTQDATRRECTHGIFHFSENCLGNSFDLV